MVEETEQCPEIEQCQETNQEDDSPRALKYIDKEKYYKYPSVFCEKCNKSICYYYMSSHLKSKSHIYGKKIYDNTSNLVKMHCDICNVDVCKNKWKIHFKSARHQNNGVPVYKPHKKIKKPVENNIEQNIENDKNL